MLLRCSVGVCVKTTIAVIFAFQLFYVPLTVVLYWNSSPRPDNLVVVATPSPSPVQLTTTELLTNDTLRYFLWEYEEYCQLVLRPKKSNVETWSKKMGKDSRSAPLCPCISDSLVGALNKTSEVSLMGDLELSHPELRPGGEWLPSDCVPRQRVAVIIPFRDREEHLRSLLSVLHPMLQRQLLHYSIFVIEQLHPAVFNKAALMNAGFTEIERVAEFDCYIFHDVDMIPLHDHNFYTCSEMPRHVGSHVDKFNFTLPYEQLFGGVTAFTPEQFTQVNGFSNQYYGWGGEDDDMYSRIEAQNLTIVRFSSSVARYAMIRHTSDELNPANSRRYSILYHKQRLSVYQKDGVRTVRYKLNNFEARPLYMWLQMTLPPHPPYFHNTYLVQRDNAISIHSRNVKVMHMLSVIVTTMFCVFREE